MAIAHVSVSDLSGIPQRGFGMYYAAMCAFAHCLYFKRRCFGSVARNHFPGHVRENNCSSAVHAVGKHSYPNDSDGDSCCRIPACQLRGDLGSCFGQAQRSTCTQPPREQ